MVRIAGPQDWDEVFRLLRLAHDESGFLPFDLPKVEWLVQRMLWPERLAPTDTGLRGLIGVIGEPDQLEGLAFIVIGTIWYASKPHLEELVVYVEPEYRPQRHVLTLIEWMKDQSRISGLPLLTGVMSTERTEAKIRLYSREIPKVGAVFRFDPITAGSSISLMVH